MKEIIEGADFRDMILCAGAALERNRAALNELNVFPVPDGDTGTNMSLTMAAAANSLGQKNPRLLCDAADVTASALLRGARGNSGVIISLLFRGISKGLKGMEKADAFDFAYAMSEGVDAAYKAVMKPAEGTILTVSRAASAAALEFADNGSSLELMLVRSLQAAKEALEETVRINPVLAKAGVVDAGGKGYVIILEAMLSSLQGRSKAYFEVPVAPALEKADFKQFDTGDITFIYCTEFIVSRSSPKSPKLLAAFLEQQGDSLVVVDDDEIIKVHVHTNAPGHVLTEALKYGTLLTVKIENMREQHTELGIADHVYRDEQSDADDQSNQNSNKDLNDLQHADDKAPEYDKRYGVVSICSGTGLTQLFKELGADSVVSGGQTMNPSTEDILDEIEKISAEIIYVLPNNKNIIMAAQQCIPLAHKKVIVIPTATVPQGVAAMLAMDSYADEPACTSAMNDAIDTVSTALVTYAARDSSFDGMDIHAGEYLIILNGKLLDSYSDKPDMINGLCSSFRETDPEFISIYYGEDTDEDSAQILAESLSKGFPEAEISVISGGQPVYCYMVAAE